MAKILIVEDEQVTAMEIYAMVEELGHTVLDTVTTGEEAVDIANEKQPDLIIMDIRLNGEMDGVEAVQEIQKNHSIPVFYLTAHSDDETLQKAKITKPSGFLVKPITEIDLKTSIEMALPD